MTVKIVTDSVADLPSQVAQELGISRIVFIAYRRKWPRYNI